MNTKYAEKYLDSLQIVDRTVYDNKDIAHPLECILEDYYQERLNMEKEILERKKFYETQRQKWIDKQKSYKWTEQEKRNDSETYGNYQEKEHLFNALISELDWVLVLMKNKS
jgi:hypothetical protein